MAVLPELRRRRSPLRFAERDVDHAQLDTLIEAARWAPSCFNNQSWHYVFVHREHPSRTALEDALYIGNGWAKRAPYVVAVTADPDADCTTNGIPYYAYDAGLSVMALTVEAEHQGLRVHQMAGWHEAKVKVALGIPEHHRVVVLFALGYEGKQRGRFDALEERIKTRLAKSRERKSRDRNFFFAWFGISDRSAF